MCQAEECCSSERLSLSRVQQVRTREEEGGGQYFQGDRDRSIGGVGRGWGLGV